MSSTRTWWGLSSSPCLTTMAVSIGWSQVWKSVFAGGTTLLASLATAGAFREKWHVNRRSRSKADELWIRLNAPDPDEDKIRAEMERLVTGHDEGILTAEGEGDE